MKLLYVKGSPRGERSKSAQIASAFIDAYRERHPNAEIEEFDLWQTALPEFDGDRAAAKMSFFGDPAMNGEQQSAWDEIVRITHHFARANDFLFTVPMWNSGIPYRLKLYIDIITQPGLLFGFDPAAGYSGLLKNKRATAIYTSGVYAPGARKAFGSDFHSAYFNEWLEFIGIEDIENVRYQSNLLTADSEAALTAATAAAKAAARR
jgi:FMN-dependent NADH-azoreductase